MTAESWSTERFSPGEKQQQSSGTVNVQQMLAGKLQELAQTVSRKLAATEPDSQMAYYGHQASEMLEGSAEYLKQLDLKDVQASVDETTLKGILARVFSSPGWPV